MQNTQKFLAAVVILGLSLTGTAQQGNPKLPAKAKASAPTNPAKLTREQKFVIDTVRMAVALPEPDQQDRLRVLSTAADVVSPIDKKMARGFWNEGATIESELVRIGQTPAVSMMSSGLVDCTAALNFVENLPDSAVLRAEQSLIGAVTSCPKQALDAVSRKLDGGLGKGVVASRALMAVMAAQGQSSAWSQQHFAKMFDALPDPKENAAEAENIAAMYMQMSGSVGKDIAAKTGLQFLTWLGKIDDSPLRTLSIRITTGAMQQAIGAEGYQKALESDLVANATVQNAGEQREIQRPEPEGVSILSAMGNKGADQTERLRGLPATQRAREAAANGFASGTSGDKQQAGKYFDMAFSAADEVWDARTPEANAAAVVQEISEAAAQVDSLNALARAQKLRDSSAQAIAMLAVARVVASNGVTR
ncbi:MAG TPA: hypothetical protein VE604_04050 [Candidatus Polarisedimenticolia bacterium]|nr:hypothetical protein [Candidatus Polarisedimenticolia bacterium]